MPHHEPLRTTSQDTCKCIIVERKQGFSVLEAMCFGYFFRAKSSPEEPGGRGGFARGPNMRQQGEIVTHKRQAPWEPQRVLLLENRAASCSSLACTPSCA